MNCPAAQTIAPKFTGRFNKGVDYVGEVKQRREFGHPSFGLMAPGYLWVDDVTVEPVGEGRTHRLSGMAVFVTAEYEGTVRAGLGVQRSAILDMWGAGAAAFNRVAFNLRECWTNPSAWLWPVSPMRP